MQVLFYHLIMAHVWIWIINTLLLHHYTVLTKYNIIHFGNFYVSIMSLWYNVTEHMATHYETPLEETSPPLGDVINTKLPPETNNNTPGCLAYDMKLSTE